MIFVAYYFLLLIVKNTLFNFKYIKIIKIGYKSIMNSFKIVYKDLKSINKNVIYKVLKRLKFSNYLLIKNYN